MPIAKRRLLDQVDLSDHEKKNLQILDTIRKKGPIARAEISRLIGLNIVTVTSYVDLNPQATYVIGVGLNGVDMIAVLCNLKGEIIDTIKKERLLEAGEALVKSVAGLVEALVEKSKIDLTRVHGIGIGIPGIFNRDTNTIRWPVGLFSEGDLSIAVSIHRIFEDRFGVPTIVDNDANTAVFGEEWYGKGLGVQHAIYLYSGNGCGFMINGQIYRGSNGCAGEWLFDEREENPLPALVNSYKSGTWYVDMGISLKAKASRDKYPKSKIYELVREDLDQITIHVVAKAAEAHDELAISLLKEAGQKLGRKAAFLVNLFNPEIIMIGGGIEICGAIFMDVIRDTVKQMAAPEATEKLRILPSVLGENGVALGAAALVAQNYFVSV